jgi:hypothetical protein
MSDKPRPPLYSDATGPEPPPDKETGSEVAIGDTVLPGPALSVASRFAHAPCCHTRVGTADCVSVSVPLGFATVCEDAVVKAVATTDRRVARARVAACAAEIRLEAAAGEDAPADADLEGVVDAAATGGAALIVAATDKITRNVATPVPAKELRRPVTPILRLLPSPAGAPTASTRCFRSITRAPSDLRHADIRTPTHLLERRHLPAHQQVTTPAR